MDTDSADKLDRILYAMTTLKSRTMMCIGRDDDVNILEVHLAAFNLACRSLDFWYGSEIHKQVISESGWESSAQGIAPGMRKRGLSEKEIVSALIDVEILKWEKMGKELEIASDS